MHNSFNPAMRVFAAEYLILNADVKFAIIGCVLHMQGIDSRSE